MVGKTGDHVGYAAVDDREPNIRRSHAVGHMGWSGIRDQGWSLKKIDARSTIKVQVSPDTLDRGRAHRKRKMATACHVNPGRAQLKLISVAAPGIRDVKR